MTPSSCERSKSYLFPAVLPTTTRIYPSPCQFDGPCTRIFINLAPALQNPQITRPQTQKNTKELEGMQHGVWYIQEITKVK